MAEMGVAAPPDRKAEAKEQAKVLLDELEQDRKEREENHQATEEFADRERERRKKAEESLIQFMAEQQAIAAERADDLANRTSREREQSYTYTAPVVGVAKK